MKILVLQLARFGDIFLTWPILRALRRKYPTAEIHVAVRSRFAAAIGGFEAVDRVWILDTGRVLGRLIVNEEDTDGSLARLSEWTALLSECDFDQVINLSFSPLSSYLTSLVSSALTKIRGYTRHADGFLSLPDDPSAYFYAQVGPGRTNRFHLAELMAAVADVELTSADWGLPPSWKTSSLKASDQLWPHPVPFICLHPGASQSFKSYPAFKWRRIVHQFLKSGRFGVAVIGGAEDAAIAHEILAGAPSEWTASFCGSTTFQETAGLIERCDLLVGADSAPMHLASHVNKKCLNVSFDGVQFWETGPRALGSRVITANQAEDLASEVVASHLESMIFGSEPSFAYYERVDASPVAYVSQLKEASLAEEFPWRLTLALYSGDPRPPLQSAQQAQALVQIHELSKIGLDQVAVLKAQPQLKSALEILSQVDLALHTVAQMVPSWRPLVQWYETEKVRIGPTEWLELCAKQENIYEQLYVVTEDWLKSEKVRPRAQQEVSS